MKDNFITGFIVGSLFFIFVNIYLLGNVKKEKQQPPKQEINQTYVQDSLCQVWVDSTHLRIAFKTWCNKNKGRVKQVP